MLKCSDYNVITHNVAYNLSYYIAVVYIQNAQTLQAVFHWMA